MIFKRVLQRWMSTPEQPEPVSLMDLFSLYATGTFDNQGSGVETLFSVIVGRWLSFPPTYSPRD